MNDYYDRDATEMTAEDRLKEWGKERHSPGWDIPVLTGGVIGRLTDVARDHRVKGRRKSKARRASALRRSKGPSRMIPCKESGGVRMEIVVVGNDSVACPPDGGLGGMIKRLKWSIDRSRRCAEIGALIDLMPGDLREFVNATYRNCATPREVPRDWDEAMRMMKVSKSTYFRRKDKLLDWIEARIVTRKRHDEELAA